MHAERTPAAAQVEVSPLARVELRHKHLASIKDTLKDRSKRETLKSTAM